MKKNIKQQNAKRLKAYADFAIGIMCVFSLIYFLIALCTRDSFMTVIIAFIHAAVIVVCSIPLGLMMHVLADISDSIACNTDDTDEAGASAA